jgi:glutamate/tyrosine decarboxylase-like PLP-dependent enzyme
MPLHNTEELKAGPTSQLEADVLDTQIMDESADKNMIDKDEYPQTAAIEER